MEFLYYRFRKLLIKIGTWFQFPGWLRGVLHARAVVANPSRKIGDLKACQHRPVPFGTEYSQNGEDGIIEAIFSAIGTTNAFFVEFGSSNGFTCNTRYLWKRKNWHGLLMDSQFEDPSINLRREFITAETIESLFQKYDVPETFDLLSIDIDGNDYWVWKAITHYRPRVVVIEYNGCIPSSPPVTIPYDPHFVWDYTVYYGASLSALATLGAEKGYTLIATDRRGVNAFFVLDNLAKEHFQVSPVDEIYTPLGRLRRHLTDTKRRPWVSVAL